MLTMLLAAAAAAPGVQLTDIGWDTTPPGPVDIFAQQVAMTDPADPQAVDMAGQALAHYGRSDLIAATSQFHRRKPCGASDDATLSMDDLVAQAAATRLVIINEAHVSPWHRATTTALLERLRAVGYTHFAAETFMNAPGDDDPVVRNAALPYASRADGSYSAEPVFGTTIRTAKALGYRLAAYEAIFDQADMQRTRSERVAKRETSQATQLAALLEADPDAKILVHVGHSHVWEVPIPKADGTTEDWMAKRLKDRTGIDPVTISQTFCTGAAGGTSRIIPVPADHRSEVGTDYVIETAPDADYRVKPEGAIAVRVPPSWRTGEGWTIIEAIRADEPDEAVPADHLAIHASETDTKALYLAPGRYRIRLRPLDPEAASPMMMMGPA